MNDDARLSRYLSERADAITLTPGDPAAVMRRGNRRRNHRRGGVLGAVAVLGVVATSVAVYDDGGEDLESNTASAVVAPSDLEWSVAHPTSGLGYSASQVELAGGAVYSLSTAPGVPRSDATSPPTLYRSDDDAEWSPVDLPSYLSPSSLAAAGDTLYAVGTAPAGGGTRTLAVAASTDGADTWQRLELPSDLADLDARYPGIIHVSPPTMAAQDATHLVAAVVVSAQPDVEALLPGEDLSAGWESGPEGVTIHRLEDCTPDTCTDKEVLERRAGRAPVAASSDEGEVQIAVPHRTYTWDELGVDAEVQSLITGRTLTYASDDGTTFDPVSVPGSTEGWGSALVATAEGYRLLVGGSYTAGAPYTTQLYRSADGYTWEADGTLPGSPMDAGVLGDRVAVAMSHEDGSTHIRVHQADGSWSTLDVTTALSAAEGTERWVGPVAFGPLGLAAVVTEQDVASEAPYGRTFLVHSADGTTVSAVSIDEALSDRDGISVQGLQVSADAITARLYDGGDADDDLPPTQTLFVGTPTG